MTTWITLLLIVQLIPVNPSDFTGQIIYMVDHPLGKGEIELRISTSEIVEKWKGPWCDLLYPSCPERAYAFRKKEEAAACRSWKTTPLGLTEKWEILSVCRDSTAEKRWVSGFICTPYTVNYEEKRDKVGKQLLRETLWIADQLPVKASASLVWHPLIANGAGRIALRLDRRYSTILTDGEVYSGTAVVEASRISIERLKGRRPH